jgi:hypothetical protein
MDSRARLIHAYAHYADERTMIHSLLVVLIFLAIIFSPMLLAHHIARGQRD